MPQPTTVIFPEFGMMSQAVVAYSRIDIEADAVQHNHNSRHEVDDAAQHGKIQRTG